MNNKHYALGATVRNICMLLTALGLQTGCATFSGYPEPVTDLNAELREMQPIFGPTALATCIKKPSLECRNSIAAAHMRAIDIRFSQFEARLFRQTREAGFAATLATLGFTSAATLTNGSARAFAATAGLLTAGRAAFDKEVMAEQTTLALHAAMRGRRAAVATRLAAGLAAPLEDYSLAATQRDLQAYEEAGNLVSALVRVTEEVSDSARKAEAELDNTIRFNLDPIARKLRNAICVDERCTSFNEENLQNLQKCRKTVGLDAKVTYFDLVFQKGMAVERAKVLVCMKL